jgi:hypothetical protein
VKAHYSLYVSSDTGEIEHTQTAETETDCGDARIIHLVLGAKGLQAELHTPLQERPVVHEGLDERPVLLRAVTEHALAEQVKRKTDVPKVRNLPRLTLFVLAASPPGVGYQHTRPLAWKRVVAAQEGLQRLVAIGLTIVYRARQEGHVPPSTLIAVTF